MSDTQKSDGLTYALAGVDIDGQQVGKQTGVEHVHQQGQLAGRQVEQVLVVEVGDLHGCEGNGPHDRMAAGRLCKDPCGPVCDRMRLGRV